MDDKRLDTAITAALSAGKYLNDQFLSKHRVSLKPDNTVQLTEDVESEKIIVSTISKQFSRDSFLSEETETDYDKNNFWIIDPLCGSYSYLRGVETWSISLAFYSESQLKIGVVYQPYSNNLFYGQIGKGAFLNKNPIKPSKIDRIEDAFISIEHGVFNNNSVNLNNLIEKIKRLRVGHGSGAELSYVAAGFLEAVIKTDQTIEHYSGGRAILEISGGNFIDFNGSILPIITDRKKKINYIACNNIEMGKKILDMILSK